MLQSVTGGVKRYPSMSYDIYTVYPFTVYFKLQRYKLFGTFKQRLKNILRATADFHIYLSSPPMVTLRDNAFAIIL